MRIINKKWTMADLNRGDCFMWNDELYIKVDFSATKQYETEFTAICLASGETAMVFDEEEVDYVDALVTY